jgi:hypothetical protein
MYFVKPAFEEFCSPVSIYIFICNFFLWFISEAWQFTTATATSLTQFCIWWKTSKWND